MRILGLALLAAACTAPAPPPPAAPLPAPIVTQIPIAPRLLPGQPPPSPESIAQQQLQRGMRTDQAADRLRALDPNRPQQTGEGSIIHSDMGDPALPTQPMAPSRVFRSW